MSYAQTHRDGIGCSEVAAILGLDPRKSAIDVWASKRGLVEEKDGDDDTAERGKLLEESVIAWAEKRLAVRLLRQGRDYPVPLCRFREDGHLLGSPDALGEDAPDDPTGPPPFGLEAKTRNYATGWGPDGSDEVPIVEATQCHSYMALTGSPYWYVAVLFGMPFEFRLYRIERDEARCARILAFVESWWQRHIVEGIPPTVADVDRSRLARLLNPKGGGEVVKSSAREVCALMERRRLAEQDREVAKLRLEQADDEWRAAGGLIEELIGSASGIETPVGSAFLNSRTSRGRLITKWPQENRNGE